MDMTNEQMQSGEVMSEQKFVWLLTAVREADRSGVLEQIRSAVEAAKE